MKFVLFYHSLVSDWNHGNAHFLRGIVAELIAHGHRVEVYEPRDGWSRRNLVAEQGETVIAQFHRRFPCLHSRSYNPENFDVAPALDGADVVIVHEWNPPELVAQIGRAHHSGNFKLLFHDTHHRSVTAPEEMARYDLRDYDGVLAFGGAVRQRYLEHGWHDRVFTWHEAADIRVFHPRARSAFDQQLVWIGNWGDGERAQELEEFLIGPVRELELEATLYGVRYPPEALAALDAAGIVYRGWLPNWRVPEVFARSAVTVHVPRGPYAGALPGIPTIRMFEALACGIPLVSAPWLDCEHLFKPGEDYLVARSGAGMRAALRDVMNDPALAASLAESGLRRICACHTCAHRVDELLEVTTALGATGMQATTTAKESVHA
ncbi:MAG TPA: glycosyltransferase [Rhodanobacteraceae bacterium]